MVRGKTNVGAQISLIWVSIGFSAFYWILEAVRDVLVFERGSIYQRIFLPDGMSFWMRIMVVCILILFGAYAQTWREKAVVNEKEQSVHPVKMGGILIAGIGFGLMYWILEAVRDVFIFEKGNLLERILIPDTVGVWMRLLAVFILILFSLYTHREVTERKRAEEALKKYDFKLEQLVKDRTSELTKINTQLNTRMTEFERIGDKYSRIIDRLKMLSQCNEVIVRSPSNTISFNQICRLIVEKGKYGLAWIGLSNVDENGSLKTIAWSVKEDKNDLVKSTIEDHDSVNNPVFKSVKIGKPCYVKISEKDTATWQLTAVKAGYNSLFSIPIGIDNKIFGVLAIFGNGKDFLNVDELDILKDLSTDLAFGIATKQYRNK
jgi:hypothetical protein